MKEHLMITNNAKGKEKRKYWGSNSYFTSSFPSFWLLLLDRL